MIAIDETRSQSFDPDPIHMSDLTPWWLSSWVALVASTLLLI
jgi:hypothetical protein